jgi:Rod binding domain-containing protein
MDTTGISSVGAAANPAAQAHTLTAIEHARAAKMRGAALRNATPAEQRAAVAAQFEAILVRQMLGKTLTSMLGDGKSPGSSVYGDMLTDTFAQQLTAGPGFGLGRMIEKQLTPRVAAATTNTPSSLASAETRAIRP